MSDIAKRQRGRPKGSGKDDTEVLAKVADLVLSEGIKPTTAMKQLIRFQIKPEDRKNKEPQISADVRRMQDKWKKDGVRFLAEAQARAEQRKRAAERARSSGSGGGYLASLANAARMSELYGFAENPTLKMLREQEEHIRKYMNPESEVIRIQREYEKLTLGNLYPENPVSKYMRDYENTLKNALSYQSPLEKEIENRERQIRDLTLGINPLLRY